MENKKVTFDFAKVAKETFDNTVEDMKIEALIRLENPAIESMELQNKDAKRRLKALNEIPQNEVVASAKGTLNATIKANRSTITAGMVVIKEDEETMNKYKKSIVDNFEASQQLISELVLED